MSLSVNLMRSPAILGRCVYINSNNLHYFIIGKA
jgi:hypothetical protein